MYHVCQLMGLALAWFDVKLNVWLAFKGVKMVTQCRMCYLCCNQMNSNYVHPETPKGVKVATVVRLLNKKKTYGNSHIVLVILSSQVLRVHARWTLVRLTTTWDSATVLILSMLLALHKYFTCPIASSRYTGATHKNKDAHNCVCTLLHRYMVVLRPLLSSLVRLTTTRDMHNYAYPFWRHTCAASACSSTWCVSLQHWRCISMLISDVWLHRLTYRSKSSLFPGATHNNMRYAQLCSPVRLTAKRFHVAIIFILGTNTRYTAQDLLISIIKWVQRCACQSSTRRDAGPSDVAPKATSVRRLGAIQIAMWHVRAHLCSLCVLFWHRFFVYLYDGCSVMLRRHVFVAAMERTIWYWCE
jgi:hypothetical protein